MESSKAWWVGVTTGIFIVGISNILHEVALEHTDWGYLVLTLIFQISFCLFMLLKVRRNGN